MAHSNPLCSAFLGLLFVTSFYPAVISRTTKHVTSKVTLFDWPRALSSHSSSSSPLSPKKSSLPRSSETLKDFISIDTNGYGEQEIRVALGNTRMHIVSIPSDTHYQLELRRTADRRHYVKSVYKKGLLRDCEFTDNPMDISKFVSDFKLESLGASAKVYPIYKHGRSSKKKGKTYDFHRNKNNINNNNNNNNNNNSENDKDKGNGSRDHKENGNDPIRFRKHGKTRQGRTRNNSGHILQILYERNASIAASAKGHDPKKREPLPYAVLYKASDIGAYDLEGGDVYLSLHINARAETRNCRLLYRRVRRKSRYDRAKMVTSDRKFLSYNFAYDQALLRYDTERRRATPTQNSPGSKNLQRPGEETNPRKNKETITNEKTPPTTHPHRHHHDSQPHKTHHISLTPPNQLFRHIGNNFTGDNSKGHHSKPASKSSGRRRSRRQLNGVLIYPGTKWCGTGNTASAFNDLGSETAADKCCREHDHCAFTIEGFRSRFNFFNYRPHTISHCECDEKFRRCLRKEPKVAEVAHHIGRLYFTYLDSPCFVLTKEKYCVERSWWGKCRKNGFQLTAKMKAQKDY